MTPKYTRVGYSPVQPVPFSHALHAGQLGIDCRYCHSNVESSGHANIPTAQTCMNCHSQVKANSPLLAVVRQSYLTGDPVPWVWIHQTPDYVYFNHAIHVNRGVSCVECHGRVDQMDVVTHAKPLSMGFCLDCHRAPQDHLRPNSEVTNLAWTAPERGGPDGDGHPVRPRLERPPAPKLLRLPPMKRKFEHPAPSARELAGPKYWRGLEELADSPGFKEKLAREFPDGASTLEGVDRRQFRIRSEGPRRSARRCGGGRPRCRRDYRRGPHREDRRRQGVGIAGRKGDPHPDRGTRPRSALRATASRGDRIVAVPMHAKLARKTRPQTRYCDVCLFFGGKF